jgi:formyltetrahydrofolate deformylase
MALFVSKYNHCLYDILGRYSAGELNVEIPLIISNHMDLKPIADQFNIPFFHVPFTKDNKESGEKQQIELLKETRDQLYCSGPLHANHNTKFDFALRKNKINIHHSFFTCFSG